MLYHVISYHIISYHIISYGIIYLNVLGMSCQFIAWYIVQYDAILHIMYVMFSGKMRHCTVHLGGGPRPRRRCRFKIPSLSVASGRAQATSGALRKQHKKMEEQLVALQSWRRQLEESFPGVIQVLGIFQKVIWAISSQPSLSQPSKLLIWNVPPRSWTCSWSGSRGCRPTRTPRSGIKHNIDWDSEEIVCSGPIVYSDPTSVRMDPDSRHARVAFILVVKNYIHKTS